MTAFARKERELPAGALVWELRSVNHRYLELSLKLPEELRSLEPQVREVIAKRLGRGKIDCALRLSIGAQSSAQLALDQGMVTRLMELAHGIESTGENIEPLRAVDILRWPGVLATPALDAQALGEAALALLDAALEEMVGTRKREGARLGEIIEQRLSGMRAIVTEVQAIVPQLAQDYRERLRTRLAELRQEVSPERLEQEIVLFAQRADVHEEIDRLRTHIDEVGRVLGQSGPQGRRLDFLMQELNREANTLGSKAADIRLTNAAVDLKVLIEQMREQVQNIE
jgi:uncharacterized protein (TIGR00255 family)